MRTPLHLLFIALVGLPRFAEAQDPERVVLKLEEFLKMYDTLKKVDEAPPRDHALASARYRGEVVFDDGKPHAVKFRAKMSVEALKPRGWARVPILPATVALQSAKIGGREASVVIEGGFYTLVTDRRGSFDLDLEFAAAVTTAEGSSGVTFQLAPSGATELELAVAASEDLDFTVANAKLQSDRFVGGNRVVQATIPATGSLSVFWQREIPEAEKKDARVYAEVHTLTGIGEGLMRAVTTVENTILFTGVDTFRYQVPSDMTILDVRGPGIRDWKLGSDGTLDVHLNFAAEGSYGLRIEMEQLVPAGQHAVDAPIVAPIGVERAKGWLGVEVRGNLEVEAARIEGASAVDVRSLPASILGITEQPILLGYKYIGAGPQIGLAIAEHDEVDVLVTLLDQTIARTMWTPEGRRLTSVTYQVRNNRRQFLRLDLPEGGELWSASVGGRAVQPARANDGKVMVPLVRSQEQGGALSAFEVEVVYIETGDPTDRRGRGAFAARLPTPDVPSTYVAWTVYSPDRTKVRRHSHKGNVHHVDTLSLPIPRAALQSIDAPVDYDVQDSFKSREAIGGAAVQPGAAPVLVNLPLQGRPTHFEKLLALDEPLEITFAYRGLRRVAPRAVTARVSGS